MLTTPDILVNAHSMTASFNSSSQQLRNMFGFSIQCVYTGSPVGTIKLQGSVDATTWDDITDASVSISAAGSNTFNVSDVGYPYVRLVYTATSGTGSITAKFFGRGI